MNDNIIRILLLVILIFDVSQLVDGVDASNKENIDPTETDDWLHRDDSFHAKNIDDELISNQLPGN